MNLLKNEEPRNGQRVITYLDGGKYVMTTYKKVWCLEGLRPVRKMRFVCDRTGKSLPTKKIEGWNRVPQAYETVGGSGHVDHDTPADDMVCGWKNEINPVDNQLYKLVMWKVSKKHHRVLSFTDNEFFAMVSMMERHFTNK